MGRPVGYALLALGAALGGGMLLWLVVTLQSGETSSGGAALGLMLAAILGIPPIAGGLFVLGQAGQEQAATDEFRAQRQVLDSDRLFGAEQRRELLQLAKRLVAIGPGSGRLPNSLQDLAHDLESPGYDAPGWYEAVKLGPGERETLQRYESLLGAGTRHMGQLVAALEKMPTDSASLEQLGSDVRDWERDLGRRSDLLRGRAGPAIAPADLLAAKPAGEEARNIVDLRVGDAVTRDGTDYLVETTVSYFSAGQNSWLHRLAAAGEEVWLQVSPGGVQLAWLHSMEASPRPGAETLDHLGSTCRLDDSAIADAQVYTREGEKAGGVVKTWRYTCSGGDLLRIEQWPNRNLAYQGLPVRLTELEIWPSRLPV